MTDPNTPPATDKTSPAEGSPAGASPEGTPASGAAGAPQIYKPKEIPDHLVGKSDTETIDLVLKAYNGARETLSKNGKPLVPEKIEDYKIEIPEDTAAKILRKDADGKDPLLESMRGVFYAEGIPGDKAATLITKFYEKIQEMAGEGSGGTSVPPADFDFKALGGADAARPVIDGLVSRLNGMKQTGKLSDADVNELTYLTAYSEGIVALQKVLTLAGEKPIPVNLNAGGAGAASDLTKDSLDKRVADPRYRRGTPSFDQAFYDETARLFQEFYAQD